MWWSSKNWFWTVSTLGQCGGLERTDFEQFLLWDSVVVLKELILNSFYFGRVWWSWKNSFWTVSTLEGCGGLEITDFEQFLLWEGVVGLKDRLWTVSTLEGCGGRCGGLERTDFEHFLLWDSVVVLKELIMNSFYFGTVWWSWKNWFWTVSTLGQCGGLERTDFEQFLLWEGCGGHERTHFEQFLLWEGVEVGVVVLKELILNSFYFGTVWWSWKNWFWTVSTLGGCGGLERTDFEQFLLWKGVELGVVVLKELILNSFYFGRVWWSWKNWLWTVSTLGRCGSLERTHFEQFLLWKGVEVGVVVLKELILNSFYFGRVGWSWKNWFWTVSTFGVCGGLERTDFEQFLLWKGVQVGVVVLKEVILNSFYFGRLWWSWKNWFWTVSTLGGCGGLEKNWFWTVSSLEGFGGSCGGLERTDFEQFLLWDSVVVLKELILNSFYFGRVWWSWKNWFWTVSTLEGCGGRCGGLERTYFEQFLPWNCVR